MTRNSAKRILVIAAHPDDEVLGCGATTARHVRAGDTVWTLILSVGVSRKMSSTRRKKFLAELRAASRRANKLLGVKRVVFKDFPDNAFDSVPLLTIIYAIEEIIGTLRPQVIYTHHHADVNVDHRRSVEAVEVAIRPMAHTTTEQVLSFEVPSSSEWNFIRRDSFRPNVFVSVEEQFLERKLSAFAEYRTELGQFPHPRSPEFLRALAVVRGGQSGYRLAEAFSLIYRREV